MQMKKNQKEQKKNVHNFHIINMLPEINEF